MTAISGCADQYCLDTGKSQVALARWGTVHYTGYPLYMLLGSVTLLRAFGAPPAMAASLYSLLWEVLAVLGLALLAGFLTGDPWLAAGSHRWQMPASHVLALSGRSRPGVTGKAQR